MKIRENDIFIVTTDTVPGIGGKVNDFVKEKIYQIKKRSKEKKLIIVVSSIEQLKKIEKLNNTQLQYINQYWPGNVTLIINDQGYRMPNNKKLLKFIDDWGPFYLSSANISNESIINDINEIKKIFPNLMYFDFGKGSGVPSVIINTKTGKKLR